MPELLGFLVVAILVALALGLWMRLRGGTPAKQASVYQARDPFLTPAERSFFGVLDQAMADDCHIFAKVRLIDVVTTRIGVADRQSHINRIIQKHLDFVLCDRVRMQPTLVIELDDSSHSRRSRQTRDEFVDRALADAGIPILRVRASSTYSPAEIRGRVTAMMWPKVEETV